jgi:hypothetical protein
LATEYPKKIGYVWDHIHLKGRKNFGEVSHPALLKQKPILSKTSQSFK